MANTKELAEKILSAIEDADESVTGRGFTCMSTQRREGVLEDILAVIEGKEWGAQAKNRGKRHY